MKDPKLKDLFFLKSFGQNFLINEKYLNKIEQCIEINNEETIEVGPGLGFLTEIISKKTKNLKLIEIDRRFVKELQSKYNVLHGDCLEQNLKCHTLVSNLPYNISTQFIIKLFLENPFNRCYLMLQKEFAETLKSNDFIGFLTQLSYDVTIHFDVPPSAFYPAPKVTSSFIELKNLQRDFNRSKAIKKLKVLFENQNKKLCNFLVVPDEIKEMRFNKFTPEMFIKYFT